MTVRMATNHDGDDIQRIYLCTFPEDEREVVSTLAIGLLSEKTTPQTLSLVDEIDGAIAGHIAFSPVMIEKNEAFQGYLLAPLGVRPDCQKRRVGSKLIQYGMQQLSDMGVDIVFVYGDPNYYGRFGFSAEAAQPYVTPYELQYPFGWQAILLKAVDIEKSHVAITCVTALGDPKLW